MSGQPGQRWVHVKPCGTEAAYKRHIRHREVPCEACRDAVNYVTNWRRKARADAA